MDRCRQITGEEFATRITRTVGGVMVGFGSHRCGHCAVVARAVERAADSVGGAVELYSIDTNHDPELTERMGVTASPTLIWYRDGKEVVRAAGPIGMDGLKAAFQRIA